MDNDVENGNYRRAEEPHLRRVVNRKEDVLVHILGEHRQRVEPTERKLHKDEEEIRVTDLDQPRLKQKNWMSIFLADQLRKINQVDQQ